MAHQHCSSFTRSQALRAAAAHAGAGLPSIESGMPAPAGTGMSRRTFLSRTLGAAVAVYGASHLPLPALSDGIAHAAAPADGRVLVSVFLQGGIDSLSVLAPVGDPQYRKLRPKLALDADAGQPFGGDGRLRWHPSAAALAQLHAEGKVTVLPAVGYTDPDQSHFTSRHFWEVGQLDAGVRTGWMGRLLDHVGQSDNPLQGLSLDGTLAPALATSRVPVAALGAPQEYDFWARGVWGDIGDRMLAAFTDLGAMHVSASDAALRQAGVAAAQAGRLRDQLTPFRPADEDLPAFTSPVSYPDSEDSQFPERMAALAAMIAAGLPLRCVALTGAGEYDTHDNQAGDLAESLKLTCDALLAFQRDLEARGLADRVIVHVWSEFGRRAQENGSAGTDHGAAGLGLVIGSRASGQTVGEFPGLTRLDREGNLRSTSDFRALYCSLCESWMGTDAGLVIPGAAKLARYKVIR